MKATTLLERQHRKVKKSVQAGVGAVRSGQPSSPTISAHEDRARDLLSTVRSIDPDVVMEEVTRSTRWRGSSWLPRD